MDKQKIFSNISIFMVCVLLGLAIGIQFKTVRVNKSYPMLNSDSFQSLYSTDSKNSYMQNDFQQMYLSEQIKNQSLQDQITQMQSTINMYRESVEQTGGASAGLEADLLRAENLAGLTDVYGPGLKITLSESKNVDPSVPLSTYIIHDTDLRELVNELLVAGAEAIAINGERVVSSTPIRCVGSVIAVNDVRYAAPYVVTAIGNSDTLYNAITMLGGIESKFRSYNINVDIQKMERIDIKGYQGKVSFEYLTTAKE